MQSGLSAGDKKWLWGTAIVTLLLASASAFVAPASQSKGPGYPSSYSAKPEGAMAAYLLLDKLGYSVRRWESPPASLKTIDADSVLILAEPTVMALPPERTALADFVKRGGRLLFCGSHLSAFLPLPDTEVIYAEPELLTARIPSAFTRDADSIRMAVSSAWKNADAKLNILYGSDKYPAAVVSQLGKGQVIWWAGSDPLTNAGIKEAQNLQLFLNVVSRPDGTPLPVYWDEYFHGQQGDLWSYVASTPVPWGIWQLVLAALIALFTYSRHSGPIVAPRIIPRLSPLEFVDTMGELYRRAGATQVAIGVPYKRLRLQLARRLGEPIDSTDAHLAQTAARRLGLPESDLRMTLEEASAASQPQNNHRERHNPHPEPRPKGAAQPKFDRKKALTLVQTLLRYSRQL